jgi:hypothetical protein
LIKPIQMAPESTRATITDQVSSENPRVDVGDVLATLLVRSFFSVTMLAPSVLRICGAKTKKPAQQLWLSAGLKSVYRITELFGSHPAPFVALTTTQRALVGTAAAIHSEILL